MSFSGTFDYTLDAKNRLTVPARMRASLPETLILSRGTETCVAIWRPDDFRAFVSLTLAGSAGLDRRADAIRRFFFSNSFEVGLDSAGRVMIDKQLMAYAGLSREVVVNGMENRIEVWDRERWTTYNDALDINDLSALFADTPGG